MGVIRGRHVSPGVYTKYTSIRTDYINPDLFYKSAKNIIIENVFKPYNIYFGFFPLKSENGIYTEEILNTLRNTPFSDIIETSGISLEKILSNVYSITEHNVVNLPLHITEEELRQMIASGETYSDIADSENNCIVLLVPNKRRKQSSFDIIDETFNTSIKDSFYVLTDGTIDDINYDLMVMYNNHYAYSRIGEDKVIRPLTLKS